MIKSLLIALGLWPSSTDGFLAQFARLRDDLHAHAARRYDDVSDHANWEIYYRQKKKDAAADAERAISVADKIGTFISA